MIAIVGFVIVFGSIMTGYLMHGGNLAILWQPAEFVIIGGAAFGAFIASSSKYSLRLVLSHFPQIFFPKSISKITYEQTLALLFSLFTKMHREGIISIEQDIETPENSSLFNNYPLVAKDKQACSFISDTLRTFLTTGKADDLGALMDADLRSINDELSVAPRNMATVAESLPGMGIVAAVLGIVITMGYIDQPPNILGEKVGAALLGTFLGILLCYGLVAPMASKLANLQAERVAYFNCIREAVMAALYGLSPMVALEYGRRAIPSSYRPSFADMEQNVRSS